MNKEDLEKIISQIESTNSKEEAYFGIFENGEVDQGDGYIKGNIEGLSLFAAELLKAAYNAGKGDAKDDHNDNKEPVICSIDLKNEWIDEFSTLRISSIHSTNEPRKKAEILPSKSKRDKVIEAGCILLLFLAFIAFVVGVITMVKWIF